MKKIFLLLFLSLLSFSVNAQQNTTIDLRWKISDTLVYQTIMEEVVVESFKKNKKDTSNTVFEKAFNSLKNMQNEVSDLNFETKLFPDGKGNIDIAMWLKRTKTDTTENLFTGMAAMNGNVVLRGKIDKTGELLSFYYNTSQTNLISILFELPAKPVSIGEKWSIDVDMIAMDQNFVADSMSRKNVVWLEKTIEKDGSRIAVIKYDIEEFVSGNFGNGLMTMFLGKEEEGVYMNMSHQATGFFSLDKGRWVGYDGVMEIDTNISMMGKKKTEFKLIPQS